MTAPSDAQGTPEGPTALPAVAIIGMAGRFPGAASTGELWRIVCDGIETLSVLDDAELEDAGNATLRADPAYVRARGVLDGADQFDAEFFGMLPREADI